MHKTQAIIVEKLLPYPPETIWRTLTTGELIAKWLMPNDFAAVVGHRFTFRTRPMGEWDGVVQCEVLVCEPPRLLSYSWQGGSDSNPAYGSRLDSRVTWTLTPVEGGTRLHMIHDGFEFPGNKLAFDMMSPGWARIMDAIARVTAEAWASALSNDAPEISIRRACRPGCPVPAAAAHVRPAARRRVRRRSCWL